MAYFFDWQKRPKYVTFAEKVPLMANTLKNDQKKSIARELYLHGDFTFEEIAEKVCVTRQTVSKWSHEGDWPSIKAGITVGKEKILKHLYMHVQSINDDILSSEERTPTPAQADILVKLSASIAKLEQESGIREYVSAGIAFLTWLRQTAPGKALEYCNYWDSFIKSKL